MSPFDDRINGGAGFELSAIDFDGATCFLSRVTPRSDAKNETSCWRGAVRGSRRYTAALSRVAGAIGKFC